jgi:hypothetical protein
MKFPPLFLLASITLVPGPAPSQAADPPANRVGRIEGRVLRTPKGELQLQAIELYPSGERFPAKAVAPDAEGRFAFADVPAGSVWLRPVFRGGEREGVSLPSILDLFTTVTAGQTTSVGLFGRGRPVTGELQVPDGVRPETVTVHLTVKAPPFRGNGRGTAQNPHWQLYGWLTKELELHARLDARGRFRIEGVREGTYQFSATVDAKPRDTLLRIDQVVEPGLANLQDNRLGVSLMPNGESDRPLHMGIIRMKPAAI